MRKYIIIQGAIVGTPSCITQDPGNRTPDSFKAKTAMESRGGKARWPPSSAKAASLFKPRLSRAMGRKVRESVKYPILVGPSRVHTRVGKSVKRYSSAPILIVFLNVSDVLLMNKSPA
jgi:hypothetical protein